MIVFTIGQVDYDIRSEVPRAVFSTMELAKSSMGIDVVWEDEKQTGCSWGSGPNGMNYVIGSFVVDQSLSND